MADTRAGSDRYATETSWVIVAGGFHQQGGMDRANAALASHLARNGAAVELVAHRIDDEILDLPRITSHLVPLPRGSFLWGERLLERKGQSVAKAALARDSRTRVVVNGGNCIWPGINWVHYVHHAWSPRSRGAGPQALKNAIASRLFRRNELRALRSAAFLVANSERTRRDLIDLIRIAPEKVETIYLGTESSWHEPEPEERSRARRAFAIDGEHPVVAFVGGLGTDERKGFDTLWEAWRRLCQESAWDGELIVAGAGRTIAEWERKTSSAGMSGRIRFAGFVSNVDELLSGADLLVSPVRYEPYGLNVQEAIGRGLPAVVTASAGVAEKYPDALRPLLLRNPDDPGELADILRRWHSDRTAWKEEFSQLGSAFRSWSWDAMAAEIVRRVDERFP